MHYILDLDHRVPSGRAAELLGGKASALAILGQADLPIPDWFVLVPEAFCASLDERQRLIYEAGEIDLLGRIQVLPCGRVRAELEQALAQLCPNGEPVAVRSSAQDEDGSSHSFAGQLESYLGRRPHEVPAAIAAVWRSAFDERVVGYRRERGLSTRPQPPAVLIQRMVHAERSGVAFSADPISGRRGIAIVSAVHGLGTRLVSGECDADSYSVDRAGRVVQRSIAHKPSADDNAASEPLQQPAHTQEPALNDEQAAAVAQLARRAERIFGRPQDIEWALEGGRLLLLQSRPITTLAALPDPDAAPALWDNSNIAESYSGVTTPLTFSFARRAYEEVYRQFCRVMGVPEPVIAEQADTFRRMLGLVRGRVYYNLANWYRTLALLPGFRFNRRFMEQMMGVKESLPAEVAAELGGCARSERLRDGLRLARSCGKLVTRHLLLPRTIRRFYARLDDSLGHVPPDLADLGPEQLAALYRRLERRLLTHWDAPIINDFFAMIFYGLLRKLSAAWCADDEGTLQNDLLCGEGGMISAEPAARVRRMAEIAREHPSVVESLCKGTPRAARREIARVPELAALYDDYLDRFGDRCMEELKLESATLRDDPQPLLRAVGRLAQSPSPVDRLAAEQAGEAHEQELRLRAEQRARLALAGRPARRLIFGWVLKHARTRVRDRENLRFERTRVFGQTRRIFLELGRRFFALDLLEDPRDIFYLEVDEVLGLVEGTATCTVLKSLVAVRRAELDNYRQEQPPADRFATRGIQSAQLPAPGPTAWAEELESEAGGADETPHTLKGIGCCPGLVRGKVRIISEPRTAILQPGEILVAERTDPGWIMLFPAAAGVIVERGSLLSHAAIVARELGIPTIVAAAGVTRLLEDDELVEIDGRRGLIRRLDHDQTQPLPGVA